MTVLKQTQARAAVILVGGDRAWVDDTDLLLVQPYRWYPRKIKGRYVYAVANAGDGAQILMHRVILGLTKGDRTFVDHIDYDGLNNTRANLRACTHTENTRNRRPTFGRSGYKWVAPFRDQYVGKVGKEYIGSFRSPHIAAAECNEAAIRKYGQFAAPNHIDLVSLSEDVAFEIKQHQDEIAHLQFLLAKITEEAT